MREERGQISGDVVVYEEFTLWGTIGGSVKVIKGGKFYVRGMIYGAMEVEDGGRVHIFGNVSGDVTISKDGKVVHSGVIGGDVINNGGRFFADSTARIMGKVKTRAGGETKFESRM
jgi:cytoskeletal protein CcmA (bactofilin family)